jgi:hypothetical protein
MSRRTVEKFAQRVAQLYEQGAGTVGIAQAVGPKRTRPPATRYLATTATAFQQHAQSAYRQQTHRRRFGDDRSWSLVEG